jgi:hypothetical protein
MSSGRHSSGYYKREIYLRFNLSAISGEVTNAKLRLNLARKGNRISQHVAFVSDDSWSESAITWKSKPSSGRPLASWSQRSGWIEADVTEEVRSEVTDNMLSLRIFTDSKNGNTYYHSREAIDQTVRPHLIVTTILGKPELGVGPNAKTSKQTIEPSSADIRFGLSEAIRKRLFRAYVLIEDKYGVHTSASKAAKRRLCNQFGITEDQAIEIAVEANNKDWPLP